MNPLSCHILLFGLKDFPRESSKVTPYAGLGLGYTTFDADDQIATIAGTAYSFTFSEESVFTYALKGGIGYEASEKATLFTEASYMNLGSFASDGSVNYDSNSLVSVMAGIRFNF